LVKITNFKIIIDALNGSGRIVLLEDYILKKERDKPKGETVNLESTELGTIEFIIAKGEGKHSNRVLRIDVTDLDIKREYRKKGFGRVLMRIIMALGELFKVPIVVDSLKESEGFYRKIGMKEVKKNTQTYVWKPRRKKKKCKNGKEKKNSK